MSLYWRSHSCLITGGVQILATAERYSARKGARRRVGDEHDWADNNFGMNIPLSWQEMTDCRLRSCSSCSYFWSRWIQERTYDFRLIRCVQRKGPRLTRYSARVFLEPWKFVLPHDANGDPRRNPHEGLQTRLLCHACRRNTSRRSCLG